MAIYIDNQHKQLYASEYAYDTVVASGDSDTLRVSLSNYAELPATTAWYIRSIRFKFQGYQDEAQVGPDTRIRCLAGILPSDVPNIMGELDDYQDFNGWPCSGVVQDLLVRNNPQQNFVSYTNTYKPKKALTLNREQDIVWNVKNVVGNDMTMFLSMVIHAERKV